MNPHIEDIARRLALSKFVAFAPDALTPLGGYPGDEDKARALFQKLDQEKTRADFVAAIAYLKTRPDVSAKVGVVGFCFGGGIANMLATRVPDLAAAVPFYGSTPKLEDVPNIKGPLLIHYAAHDDRINADAAAYQAALKANKIKCTAYTSTASTTTPHFATTRRRPRSPGGARSPFSTSSCAAPENPR